jgi:hypothetical protein
MRPDTWCAICRRLSKAIHAYLELKTITTTAAAAAKGSCAACTGIMAQSPDCQARNEKREVVALAVDEGSGSVTKCELLEMDGRQPLNVYNAVLQRKQPIISH